MSSAVPTSRRILPLVISYRKSPDPDPASFATRHNDPEPLVEVSGPSGLFKLEEHLDTVVRMNDLLVGERVFFECFAGASRDGLVSWIYIEGLPGLCASIIQKISWMLSAICRNRSSLSKREVSVVSSAESAC